MVSAQLLEEVRSLTPEDRWDLLEALQESLGVDRDAFLDAQADIALTRFRDWQAGRVTAIPWEEAKAALHQDFLS